MQFVLSLSLSSESIKEGSEWSGKDKIVEEPLGGKIRSEERLAI